MWKLPSSLLSLSAQLSVQWKQESCDGNGTLRQSHWDILIHYLKCNYSTTVTEQCWLFYFADRWVILPQVTSYQPVMSQWSRSRDVSWLMIDVLCEYWIVLCMYWANANVSPTVSWYFKNTVVSILTESNGKMALKLYLSTSTSTDNHISVKKILR